MSVPQTVRVAYVYERRGRLGRDKERGRVAVLTVCELVVND